MGMNTKWVNGNLVYIDAANKQRWLDAQGPGVCKFVEDFVQTCFGVNSAGTTTIYPNAFTTTQVNTSASGTIALTTSWTGGSLNIVTGGQDDDAFNLQLKGEAFKLASNKPLYFGVSFQVSDATQSDFFIGLAITDTDILGGVTDSIGFTKADGSTSVSLVLNKNSTATTGAVATLADGTNITLEFYFDGTNVDCWVDGVLQTRLAMTNLPDDEDMTPSINFIAGSAGAKSITTNWMRCIQLNS